MSIQPHSRTFRALELHDWRQFARVEFSFHDRLTVITGANAAGKTTVLNLLSQHFGWASQFVGVPGGRSSSGLVRYLFSWRRWLDELTDPQPVVGHMTYSDGTTTDILVPAQAEGSAVYQAQFRTMQPVVGLYLTSHRSIAVYQAVTQIPTTLASREQLLEQHVGEYRSRYAGSHTGYTATYRVKEALIALGTFGSGSDVLTPNSQAADLFHGFEAILRRVLPPSLDFQRLRIELPELVLETGTGPFPLDAISGGIQAIIDVAWQVYLRAADDSSFVVLIDEPENHLHPELQRALLPGLLEAFPMAQFVVATHNPFVVTSVPDSHVYALRYNDTGRVEAILLGGANKAGSSNEVLRDVLGLDSTMPLWVERRLDSIVDEYATDPSPDRLRLLRDELLSLGMGGVYTDAVERIIDERA